MSGAAVLFRARGHGNIGQSPQRQNRIQLRNLSRPISTCHCAESLGLAFPVECRLIRVEMGRVERI